jgi:SSS family solute:Na+ symporter
VITLPRSSLARLLSLAACATLGFPSRALAQAAPAVEDQAHLGTVNFIVLLAYLAGMLSIGLWCSRKNTDTEQYFVASRKIPGWAAGISVFGTQLSAITFITVPGTSFKEDWVRFLASIVLMVAIPLVIYFFLPFYRSVPTTTVYEYIERRFSLPVRWLACLIWMTFTIGRMGIMVYIPSFALEVATGLNVYLCILLMGGIVTVYSTLGGVEAVIWTDVIQVIVLLGGALLCLAIAVFNVGGVGEVFDVAMANNKFGMIRPGWSPTDMVPWVLVFGGVIIHLVPYTTDQTVAQRYFTTPTTRDAARGLWINFWMTPFVLTLFYALGTALYVFYTQHPELPLPLRADGVVDADKVVPWYVVRQLPVGVAGVVIAAVFAATMSSLDSSINSIATSGVTDFYRRLVPDSSDRTAFRLAQTITLTMGMAGTAAAAVLATIHPQLLFDVFNTLAGVFGGPVFSVFVLAIFTRRASSAGAIAGAVVSAAVVLVLAFGTKLNFYLYAATGTAVGVTVGYLVSLVAPDGPRDLRGLTIFTRLSKAEVDLT